MRVSCFGGHQEQQKRSAIGTEFICNDGGADGPSRKLSFCGLCGRAGHQDEERDEEINGTARRCFLGDASISFEDFLMIRGLASQEVVAAVLLELEQMARLVLCPEEAEDYRVGGVRLVEEEFCTRVGDGEVSHGALVPGVELQVFVLVIQERREELSGSRRP